MEQQAREYDRMAILADLDVPQPLATEARAAEPSALLRRVSA